MHLELDISDSKIRYESGDHVAVYPANDSALVNQLGRSWVPTWTSSCP